MHCSLSVITLNTSIITLDSLKLIIIDCLVKQILALSYRLYIAFDAIVCFAIIVEFRVRFWIIREHLIPGWTHPGIRARYTNSARYVTTCRDRSALMPLHYPFNLNTINIIMFVNILPWLASPLYPVYLIMPPFLQQNVTAAREDVVTFSKACAASVLKRRRDR